MAQRLPAHWRAVKPRGTKPGSWRYDVRDKARFARFRSFHPKGVEGVTFVGGRLKPSDPEYAQHAAGAWVKQSIVFARDLWALDQAERWVRDHAKVLDNPHVPAALYDATELEHWEERDRMHVELRWRDTGETIVEWWDDDARQAVEDGFLDPRDLHGSAIEYAVSVGALAESKRARRTARGVAKGRGRRGNPRRGKYAILTVPEQHQLRIAKDTLKLADAMVGVMGGMTKAEARAIVRRYLGEKALAFYDAPPVDNPPAGEPVCLSHVTTRSATQEWYETASGHAKLRAQQLRAAGFKVTVSAMGGQVTPLGAMKLTLLTVDHRGEPDLLPPVRHDHLSDTRTNPPDHPATERAKSAALEAIDRLVDRQGELSAAIVQVREKAERGTMPEAWDLNRLEGARQAVEAAQNEVRRAVAMHGAVIQEFHVEPPVRRSNPPGTTRAAVELYREFHGQEPNSYSMKKIPDLSRLVHLGRALEVHYQAAVARGKANTPYRHEFSAGCQLLAPPGGGALVILGPITVSRAPRGRYGYIHG